MPAHGFNCLAIETATDRPSLALLRGDEVTLRESPGLAAPSRLVFEWAEELLHDAGASVASLDCIAFGAGPGSFTGTRVAVALAQGLGYAAGLPLVSVSTLAALAAAAFDRHPADVAACCLDAHMGEVYVGVYARDPVLGVRALVPDLIGAPTSVCLPFDADGVAAGPGLAAYPDLSLRWRRQCTRVDAACLPSAADVARLARPRFLQGEVIAARDAAPNYLRQRVAVAAA